MEKQYVMAINQHLWNIEINPGHGTNVKVQVGGDARFSLCGGYLKTTKSLSAFFKLVYFSSLLVDG